MTKHEIGARIAAVTFFAALAVVLFDAVSR